MGCIGNELTIQEVILIAVPNELLEHVVELDCIEHLKGTSHSRIA